MFYQPAINMTPEEVLDYLRKSQSDDPTLTVEEVLANHERILDEWAERHLGAKVPEQNKFREVVSGETMKERPGIQKVLRLIESPKYKAVAVVEPQRLTRGDNEEIGRLMKLIKYSNTLVITPQRTYDLRDEYDWDAFERELKRGNDYLEYTKKILNRGRLLSVSKGNYVGNVAPYGYDKDTVSDGKRKCPTLKINEEQAEVVRMIFDMYVNQDMGRTNICHTLDSMGIKPPRGKKWSPEGMWNMLDNIHYIGKVRWNWRKTVNIVEDGEIRKTRPKAKIGEYLIYDGKHPAIISEELFNAAQAKKGRNHRAKPKTKIRNPLASILYCQCGRAMSLRTYKSHNSPPRLICDGQVHCKTGSCLYDEMIDRVAQVLEQCIEDFEIRLADDTADSAKMHTKLIKSLEKKLAELEAKELAQWDLQADPDPDKRMPPHIFKRLNEKLLREKEEINQALCKAYESMPEPVDYEKKVVRFRDALKALKDPAVDAQKKNTLLKQCIERIEYHRDTPQRIQSQQERYYDPERKHTRWRSPLPTGGNWTAPPIELDVKLKV
jgi:DNA invertase Pin-like site-specific DNA recombinase